MARIARVVLPGVPHHVVQRGGRRQETFFQDDDYAAYVALMAESCERARTQVLGWCLMPNHVHLVLVPATQDGLRAAVAEAHRRYTRRINFREGWRGHLWQERFHSFALDQSHLLAVLRYVELNPVKARLVRRAEQWRWSSARFHTKGVDDGLSKPGSFGPSIDNWSEFLRIGDDADAAMIGRCTRTGRPLGPESFMRRAEKTAGRILRPLKPGPKPPAPADKKQATFKFDKT
jgi:putative transposase